MRLSRLAFVLGILLVLLSCGRHYFKTKNAYNIFSVNNNVCKKLSGKVVIYAIFVDARQTRPWTTYDIATTLDSIRKAAVWIEEQAGMERVPLSIDVVYHENKQKIPIEKNLFDVSLTKMLFSPDGIDRLNLWANSIAAKAGESFPPDTAVAVQTKNIINNRERLIARLRDKYKTDNVVIMYFLNNYYTDEISLALFCGADTQTEFSIVSFKYPAVIAHEFLHIFGAVDMYMSPFSKKKKALKNSYRLMQAYPTEIMAYAHRPIEKLSISPISQYLIGWKDSLTEKDRQLLVGKKLKVYKY